MFIMIKISNFLFNFINFCVIVSFLTKLVTLEISHLTSFVLALRQVLVARSVISDILSSVFFILALYKSFLTTSFFTTLLSLLNQQEQVLIYQHLIYLLYFLNFLNHLTYFSIYQHLIYLHQILSLLNQLFQQNLMYQQLLHF